MTEQDYSYHALDRYPEGTEFASGDQLDFQRADKRMLSPEAVRALRLVDEAYAVPEQEKEATHQEQAAQYIASVGINLDAIRRDKLNAA